MIHDSPRCCTVQDGDWDLVNMQRLSKAVEDTGKDDADPTPPDNNTASPAASATPASSEATAAPVSRTYAPGQAWAPAAKAAAGAEATDTDTDTAIPSGDGGFEESKSSDEGGEKAPTVEQVSSTMPPAMATKWHRELCSLAEMGFENTPRNVQLLEKHVVESGSAGMER